MREVQFEPCQQVGQPLIILSLRSDVVFVSFDEEQSGEVGSALDFRYLVVSGSHFENRHF